MATITRESIENAQQDLSDLSDVVTLGVGNIITTRTGEQIRSLATVINALEAQAYIVLSNVTALRAYTRPSNIGAVILNNLTGTDSLGGVYYWDSSSNLADDGKNVIDPTTASGAGRWRRLYKDSLKTPEAYGASGNGSSYDESAFTAMEADLSGTLVDLRDRIYKMVNPNAGAGRPPVGNTYLNGRWQFDGDYINGSGYSDHIFPSDRETKLSLLPDGTFSRMIMRDRGAGVTDQRRYICPGVSVTGSNSIYKYKDGGIVTATAAYVTFHVPRDSLYVLRGKKACFQFIAGAAAAGVVITAGSSCYPECPLTDIGTFRYDETLIGTRTLSGLGTYGRRPKEWPFHIVVDVPSDVESLRFTIATQAGFSFSHVSLAQSSASFIPEFPPVRAYEYFSTLPYQDATGSVPGCMVFTSGAGGAGTAFSILRLPEPIRAPTVSALSTNGTAGSFYDTGSASAKACGIFYISSSACALQNTAAVTASSVMYVHMTAENFT